MGSPSFRTASLVQPLWSDLSADGHYFGGDENNVGFVGGCWTFHGESWKIAPGFGVNFGDNGFRTMPAVALRWGLRAQLVCHRGFAGPGATAHQFLSGRHRARSRTSRWRVGRAIDRRRKPCERSLEATNSWRYLGAHAISRRKRVERWRASRLQDFACSFFHFFRNGPGKRN